MATVLAVAAVALARDFPIPQLIGYKICADSNYNYIQLNRVETAGRTVTPPQVALQHHARTHTLDYE